MYLDKLKLHELKGGEQNVGSYPCSAVCMMSSCGVGIQQLWIVHIFACSGEAGGGMEEDGATVRM